MNITRVSINPANYSTAQYKKTGIVLHWIVGEIAAADATFQNPARKSSATFAVGSNGEIHQYMEEAQTAFHATNWGINMSHFGIEHAGGQLINGIRKKPTQACHDASAELVAYLCKKYGIACNRTNIIKHNQVVSTECPGTLDVDYIVAKANEIINATQPAPTPIPQPEKAKLTWTKFDAPKNYICNKQPTNLWNFNQVAWSGFSPIKAFNKGDKLTIFGQVRNETLGATYLLTEYSYSKNITNGFNSADLDLVTTPTPEPEPAPQPVPQPKPDLPAPEPIPEPTPVPQPEPTPIPSPTPVPVSFWDSIRQFIEKLIQAILGSE